MFAVLIKIIRLIWPFVREMIQSNKEDPFQGKNKEVNMMFVMFILLFGVSLYQVDHGLNNHRFYMEKISDAALSLERSKNVNLLADSVREENLNLRQANKKTQDELGLTNRLLSRALDALPIAKAEEILNREMAYARSEDSREKIRSRLGELGAKYPGGNK